MMLRTFHLVSTLAGLASSSCFTPSPAFPVPSWSHGVEDLEPAFDSIQTKLHNFLASEAWDAAYVSVEVTSSAESLWSYHHTARARNATRPGVKEVDGDSLYRIASITKTFTVLGLLYQHKAGNLNLDSPISQYIPELAGSHTGELPWKDITLRSLASQLSGIPRDFAQSDIALDLDDPTKLGLPPIKESELRGPRCDAYSNFEQACNDTDLLDWLKNRGHPVFAPNQKSTYSNLAFELLGVALERATNISYEQYMQKAIFNPLDMTFTTISTPTDDSHAIIPLGFNYWDVQAGVQNPTGGIYSSTNDMSKYLRYILTHYNALATGVNWLLPASWSGGLNSFYGMPWEIFRSDRVLKESQRPVTFVTKGGGLPGYSSKIVILPEYGLGVTLLVGHEGYDLLDKLLEIVTVELVRAAEALVWKDMHKTYSGSCAAHDKHLNSSISFTTAPSSGLVLEHFISNGTDVIETVISKFLARGTRPWRLQLTPTLLFKDEKKQQGEIWRASPVSESDEGDRAIWDDFCVEDVDTAMYGGLPLTEVVFWHEEREVEFTAWRVRMGRVTAELGPEVLNEQMK